MKRALSPEKVEYDGKIIEDLLNANQPDALLTFLANLEPPELYVLSKIPRLGQLRAFLNRPGVFKSLFDRRTENNGPEKDVAKFVTSIGKPIKSYWRLWLSSWAPVYQDEIYQRVVFGNGLCRVEFEGKLWNDAISDLFSISVWIDPAKLGGNHLDRFFIADNSGLRWHPVVLKLVDFIQRIITKLNAASVKSFHHNWEQSGLAGGVQHVYTLTFGSNVNNEPFFANNVVLPYGELRKSVRDSKVIEKLSKFGTKDLFRLSTREVDSLNGVSVYAAENFVWVWSNYVQAVLFYMLLENEKYAFLEVYERDFGVRYLRSCVVCGEMANYHNDQSFCSEKCFNFSVSNRD